MEVEVVVTAVAVEAVEELFIILHFLYLQTFLIQLGVEVVEL